MYNGDTLYVMLNSDDKITQCIPLRWLYCMVRFVPWHFANQKLYIYFVHDVFVFALLRVKGLNFMQSLTSYIGK